MKKLIGSIFVLTATLVVSQVHAASFSCQAAKLKTEHQVCNTLSLNDADVKLATTYQIILHALPMGSRDAEKDKQFQWLKQRNACGATKTCIQRAYTLRQQQLDQLLQDRVFSHGPF